MLDTGIFPNKQTSTFLLFWLLLPALASAQTEQAPLDRFEQLKRRMDEQMRRMFPVDSTSNGGQFQVSPDSSSYFYFHADTTFDGNGSHFFDFRSFDGNGSPMDFNQLFEQFFQGMNPFEQPRKPADSVPDDGNSVPSDDNLLPEERLRQQEVPKTKPKGATVKTIRI
ncbi:MAG: hypothetical protein ACKVU2_01550 [Saprospiraceae bacterium]